MENLKLASEQLFKYGPYAVLALFSLWVAPRQTKIFTQCNTKDNETRFFCGGIAIACWTVVIVMTYFIYLNWPPKKIYMGSFGKHDGDSEFITTERDFFISSSLAHGAKHEWRFAVVGRNDQTTPNKKYTFTFIWGEGDNDYTDYEILEHDLKKGLNFYANPDSPGTLLYDNDNNPETEKTTYQSVSSKPTKALVNFDFGIGLAHASEHNTKVIKQLNSANKRNQAHARKKLRNMSVSELKILLKAPDLNKTAKNYVKLELNRRD